jgi:outer membrane PBP1 activator LpoA protein
MAEDVPMHRRLCSLIVVVGAGTWLAGCATSSTKPESVSELQKTAAKSALLREADSAGIIDDFDQTQQTQQTWKVEAWANQATLTPEKGTRSPRSMPSTWSM